MSTLTRYIAKRSEGRRKARRWSGPLDEEYFILIQTTKGILPGLHRARGAAS